MKVAKRRAAIVAAAGAAAVSLLSAGQASAGTLYFDTDGATAGSGNPSGTHVWNSTKWTTDPAGASATTAWVAGSDAIFAAGTDATGSTYTVTLGRDSVLNSVAVQEGNVSLYTAAKNADYGIRLDSGRLTVESGATASALFTHYSKPIAGAVGFQKLGDGTFLFDANSNGVSQFVTGYSRIIAGTARGTIGSAWVYQGPLMVYSGATFDGYGGANLRISGLSDGTTGGGTVTNSSTNAATVTLIPHFGTNFNYSGKITGNTNLTKAGGGSQTLSGDNLSTGTTAVNAGLLTLDYSSSTTNKISTAALKMAGGTLALLGNDATNINASVASLTLSQATSSSRAAAIQVTSGSAANATLNLGAITRSARGATVDFATLNPGSGTAAITTTSPNTDYGLLGTGAAKTTTGTAYATFGGGRDWAVNTNGTVAGTGNVVAMTSAYTEQNAVGSWATNQHVTSGSSSGFTGSLGAALAINSLRFNAAGTADLGGNTLTVRSGGVLVTPDSGTSNSSITNGSLTSTLGELVVHQYNEAAEFLLGAQITGATTVSKSGTGTLVLSNAANNFSSSVNVMEGTLALTADNALGTGVKSTFISGGATLELRNVNYASTSNTISFQGGLYAPVSDLPATVHATGGVSTWGGKFAVEGQTSMDVSRFDVDNGSELKLTNAISITEKWSKVGKGQLTQEGVFTTGGNFKMFIDAGKFVMSGSGSELTGGGLYVARTGATFSLDNAATNSGNRLAASTDVSLMGGTFSFTGNAGANSSEAADRLQIDAGANLVDVQRGSTANESVMTFVSLPRGTLMGAGQAPNGGGLGYGGGTVVFRGTNLGQTDGGSAGSLIKFTTAPGLTGPGNSSNATTWQIIAGAVGQEGTTGKGTTFVTYNATNGVVPLGASNYDTNALDGSATNNNVLTNSDVTLTANRRHGVLVVDAGSNAVTIDGAVDLRLDGVSILKRGANAGTISANTQFGGGTVEGFVFVTEGSLTMGAIKGTTGSLTKSGAGTLILNSTASTITGAVIVNDGTLHLDANGAAGTGDIAVRYGATLTGTGTHVGGLEVAYGGTVAPGNSPGTLTVGNLNLYAGAEYKVDITGTSPSQYDSITANGDVNLYSDLANRWNPHPDLSGAILSLTVSGLDGGDIGSTFTIINNDGTSDPVFGQFNGLAQGAIITSGSNQFTISYVGENGNATGGNDVVLTLTAAVPEPASLGLLGLAGLGALGRRRRRA